MRDIGAYLFPVIYSVVFFAFFTILLALLKAGPLMALFIVVALTVIDVAVSRSGRNDRR